MEINNIPKKKTPIEILTEALAKMTERAITAERELEAERQNFQYWYKAYHEVKDELAETNKDWNEMRSKLDELKKKYEGEKND